MVRSAAVVVTALILPTFAQAQEQPGTHEVVRGNTLWDLAAFYYEDPFQWRVIWDANRDVVEDPRFRRDYRAFSAALGGGWYLHGFVRRDSDLQFDDP